MTLFDTAPSPKMKPDGTIETRGRKKHLICPHCKKPRNASELARKATLEEAIEKAKHIVAYCDGQIIQKRQFLELLSSLDYAS